MLDRGAPIDIGDARFKPCSGAVDNVDATVGSGVPPTGEMHVYPDVDVAPLVP